MSKKSYTFQVLKYSHDPAAGEVLNIGVILYCPGLAFLALRTEHKFERLSKTFAGFDGESYRYVVRRFESAVDALRRQYSQALFGTSPNDVSQITAEIWPDTDLSIKLGSVLSGVTDDPDQALTQIFDRMVLSQGAKEEKHARSDEEVWAIYKKPLIQRELTSVLAHKNISTSEFSIDFDHAFKNQRWHVLQPMSFDLARADTVQRKAAQWLGNATALKDQKELGTLYLLLGEPQLASLKTAYEKAKRLLSRIPIKHEIIEENEADSFAERFKDFVRKH